MLCLSARTCHFILARDPNLVPIPEPEYGYIPAPKLVSDPTGLSVLKFFLTCVPSRRERSVSWWPWWWSLSWWAWPGPPPRCTRPRPARGSTAHSAQPAHNTTWSTTRQNTLFLNQKTQQLRPDDREHYQTALHVGQCSVSINLLFRPPRSGSFINYPDPEQSIRFWSDWN